MTANQIRNVVALAEAGSFLHAARILGISQPTLSRAISALERELGVPLFDRLPRGVALTEFGQRVVSHGRTMIAADDDLIHDLACIRGLQSGRVSVALGPYASVISGYSAASRLLRSHPKLTVSLRVVLYREGARAVLERHADLALHELSGALENDALATEPVGHHLARFFCRPNHPILARRQVGLQDLVSFPWVTSRMPARIGLLLRGLTGRAGKVDVATGDFLPAIQLEVPIGLGDFPQGTDALAIGAYSQVEPELRAGKLAVVPFEHDGLRAGYSFIWLRHRSPSPATLAYMEAVREEERAFREREAELEVTYRPRELDRARPPVRKAIGTAGNAPEARR